MSECCGCGKVVDVAGMQAKQRKVLVIVLLINLATFVMMALAAWHSHSSSLLSGSLDNLGDALTYAVSLAVVGASSATSSRTRRSSSSRAMAWSVAVSAPLARSRSMSTIWSR